MFRPCYRLPTWDVEGLLWQRLRPANRPRAPWTVSRADLPPATQQLHVTGLRSRRNHPQFPRSCYSRGRDAVRTLSWARGWQQDGFQPWSRVRKQVERWIIQADPELAAAHAQDAAERRHVGVGAIVDGHCDLWGRLDAADGIALDHALDAVADQLPGAERDHRRARALGVIARSALGQEPLPAASRPELLATSGGATPNRDGEVSSGATACDLTTEHERDAGTGGVRRARRADLVVHISASDALELHDGVSPTSIAGDRSWPTASPGFWTAAG